MSYQGLEEDPGRGTSGLTSASQLVDTTGCSEEYHVDNSTSGEYAFFPITTSPIQLKPVKTHRSSKDEELDRILDEVFEKDREILRKLSD